MERRKKIKEWWVKDLALIASLNLTKSSFSEMVHSSDLHFRNGIDSFLKACTHFNVPLVIVSAALTDVVERSI